MILQTSKTRMRVTNWNHDTELNCQLVGRRVCGLKVLNKKTFMTLIKEP